MAAQRHDLLQGTLDLLILKIVARQPMHGYGVMQRLGELTGGVFQVTPGSLFPSLRRLEEAGCITGSWGTSENNRRARFYAITKKGQKELALEEKQWGAITLAITNVLDNA
jgi:PadR family transcriptional regulator, regulatory protein PadR